MSSGHPLFQSGGASTTFIDETPELLKYDNPLNRGNKILQYIADTTINGFPGIGREEKLITPADRLPKNLNPVIRTGPSAKQILDPATVQRQFHAGFSTRTRSC